MNLSATSQQDVDGTAAFLSGGGEMGALMRLKDWSATSLGMPSGWPQSLKVAISIMLTSRYAMWMAWGADLTFFCNDAYKPTLGVKGTWALGTASPKVWEEIWPEIGPRIQKVFDTATATWDEELLLFLERSGYPEETYHTFSYSPIPGDDGGVAGMLCVVTEETVRVIGERRLAFLRDLAADLGAATSEKEVFAASQKRLAANQKDLPFTLIYLFDEDDTARRALSTGFSGKHTARPTTIDLSVQEGGWPAARLSAEGEPIRVGGLEALFGNLPTGAWDKPPRDAVLLPFAIQGQVRPVGFLAAGINPYRPFDDAYAGFVDLVAGQIAASLANARARDADRRRAEALAEIDRAKTLFFSNVSHEFRTPLTLMLSPLEDALNDASLDAQPAAQQERLDVAHRNALRLLKLVNSLLDFSRIEAGRVQAVFRATDLAALTAEIGSSFRSTIERAGLAFVIGCPPLPEPVFVDRDMWEKIILNLLSNAFKFTFAGEIAVSLRSASAGRAVDVVVRDSGVGIPAHELPRLFERFHRVESQQGRTFEGSGVGLALVQELVRIHGGSIRVESEPGRGTSFTITLPLGSDHLANEQIGTGDEAPMAAVRAEAYVQEALRWLPEAAAGEAAALAAPIVDDLHDGATPAAQPGARILLADDNADMRDYIRRLLQARGYAVDAVADGEQALAAARRNPPDLVLSDVMMPKLDGVGLLKALRGVAALRDIPVLLLSARAGEEARLEGFDAGADDYLTKPFSARELLARIASNLQLSKLRSETRDTIREEARALELLNQVGSAVAAELNLDRVVQKVTDAATELSGAAFGAFFYNVLDDRGESYMLYTLSGVSREAFASFPMPRNTAIFAPTFAGEGVVRSDDIHQDPRYGKNAPYHGMPKGHLPVRSYLAAPVISRSGEVLGGLFFGHPDTGVFTDRAERLVTGIAAQAAIAIDNARLFQAAQSEITRRQSVENELRQLNETLESHVRERTRQLSVSNEELRSQIAEREKAEEALRQAQKMETIGHLTGGVAHDFNNLLTIILGNLESMNRQISESGIDPSRIKRLAENASRGAQRAASLTQRLLAFARRQPLDPRPIDVNKLLTGMSDLLHRTLGEQIAIQPVLAGGLWRTHADPNQLEVAVLNLAVNARDAMPEGGKLTIETSNAYLDEDYSSRQAEVMPGQYVAIAITDTGIGMTKEIAARAFEPFFTTKDTGHGTGLGLSQVYGFVKQTGGHAKIYSEFGEGTTVRIYLPRLMGEEAEMELESETATVPRGSNAETILVVEDDEDVRAHSAGTLQELGYRILEAGTGKAALEILERHPEIALLFTDVGLPGGMNGRQLADAARARRPDLKVLFTTGYAKNAIVHEGRLDPGIQLVTKPFVYATLAGKVRDLLDANRQPAGILVVEDEVLVRMVATDALDALGFRSYEAGSAREALDRMKAPGNQIDAVIVDIGLPDRKGDALALELRGMRKDLPIIIASGYTDPALVQRFAGDELVGFLRKPYAMDDMAQALSAMNLRPPKP